MNITKAQAATLGRKNAQPTRADGELLAVFIPGPIQNPLNGSLSRAHWSKKSRWAKSWRERTQMILLEAIRALPFSLLPVDKRLPKRVTFGINLVRKMDDDNLRATVKPCRDALVDMRVIHDDGPDSGHEFVYVQRMNRLHRGVEIRVSPGGSRADGTRQ